MSDAKIIRGQLRQITKEIMPELLSQELKSEVYKRIREEMTTRINAIEENVKATLDQLDQRSKDTLDYLVRQSTIDTQLNKAVSQPITEAPLTDEVTKA